MKTTIKSLGMALLGIAFTGTQLLANTTGAYVNILSDNDWQTIEESAELESMLDIDAIEPLKVVAVETLELDFLPGIYTNLELEAPFQENERVGVAVLDEEGEIIYSKNGSYSKLKNVRFNEYWNYDQNFIIKMYSLSKVYETKLQVAYPQ